MSNLFKDSLKNNYRFTTPIGEYDTEMLFKLSLPNLDKTIIYYDEQISKSINKSYLDTQDKGLDTLKNKREIVLEILTDKKNEEKLILEKRLKEKENKKEKQDLLELLAEKRKESLKSLTEEQILEKLNSLNL